MNLYHLRYFLSVAQTGSFSQAAREMHVTQPTVSSGIAELEKTMGVRLFNRGGKRVALTMEGRTLVNYAMQIQDLVEEVEDHLQRRDVLPGEGFQFGAIDAAVTYLLPDILKDYMRAYPNVSLSAQVAPSRYLVDDLLMNRSEFAVISLPYDHPRVETVSIYRDSMPLVVGASHSFAARKGATLQEVVQEPLILFHTDSISRKIVDERFAEAGVSPGVVMEMRSPEAMRKLVEVGVGISFLPMLTVQESLDAGALKMVDVEGVAFSREIGVAWRRGRYFSAAIRYLIEAIFQAYQGLEVWHKKVGDCKMSMLKLKRFAFGLFKGLCDEGGEVERGFDFADFFQIGTRFGVFGYKDRTTIFVGFNGDLICADAPCFVDDFFFVVTGQWAQDGQWGHFFDGAHVRQGLRGDLSDIFACDKCLGIYFFGYSFCNAQHGAAVENDAVARRCLRHDVALNFDKWHQVEVRHILMPGEESYEVFGVALGIAIGIRLAVKMYISEFDTAFHNFVRSHG